MCLQLVTRVSNFLVFVLVLAVNVAAFAAKTEEAIMKSENMTNELIHEKSPYLLQHARNPVNWYPWGEKAFKKARQENKPIFLSIGYSTCHWCHVMEKESFENQEIAKVMNDHFVSIKVDREERPDVDQVYMQAVMTLTGSGGWPMSVFLTPERKPFYGGTYFPPMDYYGRPGFRSVLHSISQKWEKERDRVLNAGEQITNILQTEVDEETEQSHALDIETLRKGYEQFESRFDSRHGGFSGAPKFPSSHNLSFLLRYWKRTHEAKALAMVEQTLKAMAEGGMFDHLGGGFHRYSTDGEWHIPHFEKMLYDQAILAKTYLEAYQITQNDFYAKIARQIFDYVLRDMTGKTGGFYSAEDADSAQDPKKPEHKSEGAFYIWSEQEILGILGEEVASLFNFHFDVRADGNASQDPQGEFSGLNILRVIQPLNEGASKFGKSPEDASAILEEAKRKLWEVRSKRPRPHLDDKILTDWNGLMISSLALGSRVLGETKYRDAARQAADFILNKMKNSQGRLMHRYRDEEVAIPGFLEDYAFFIHGLLDLYEGTFEVRYLEEARFFTREMIRLFGGEKEGGFFFVGQDGEKLITTVKEIYDGAIPSGNSVAVLNLLRVGRLTMDRELETKARETLAAFAAKLAQMPAAHSQMMIALDFVIGPSREIVIAWDAKDQSAQEILNIIYKNFLPNKVVAFHPNQVQAIEALMPFLKQQVPIQGKPTVYICENYVCKLPVTDLSQLDSVLNS